MQKRNIPRSNDQNNFLGYKVKVTGYIDAHIKGGLGTISDWPQFHMILKKLQRIAHWEHPPSADLMNAGKVILTMECGRNLGEIRSNMRLKIEDLQIEKDGESMKELKIKGRLFKVENANYLLSQDTFKNIKLYAYIIGCIPHCMHTSLYAYLIGCIPHCMHT